MRRKIQKVNNEQVSMEEAIITAIVTLKERGGSTMASIIKYINALWPHMESQILRTVARRMVKSGELNKLKRMYKVSKKGIEMVKEVNTQSKKRSGRKLRKVQEDNAPDLVIVKEKDEAPVKAKTIRRKRRFTRRSAPRSQQKRETIVVQVEAKENNMPKKRGVRRMRKGRRTTRK